MGGGLRELRVVKKPSRWAAAVVALLLLPLAAASVLADTQPNTTVPTARKAYDQAISIGTPSALHNFLLAYPDSTLAAKALEILVQKCAYLTEEQKLQPLNDACNLSELIAPAAPPGGPVKTDPDDPPTEHSARDNASGT